MEQRSFIYTNICTRLQNRTNTFTEQRTRATIYTVALLLLFLLMPRQVQAQTADTPMPLPDLLLYGKATQEGVPLNSGKISAVLPRGHSISSEIAPISGTDYGFVLPIPLSMYATGALTLSATSAQIGEQVTFRIDNRLALLKESDSTTAQSYTIPAGLMGSGQLVEIVLAGPTLYTAGDVNANGARDAGDAMMAVRYGMALAQGGQEFPPADGELYLPLCDMNEDDTCDTTDAQQILQCDVGQTDVGCPAIEEGLIAAGLGDDMLSAASFFQATAPSKNGAVRLRQSVQQQAGSGLITVQFTVDDEADQFGAASTTLAYDKRMFVPVSCNANPDQALDMGACNLAYRSGRIRFNAFTISGGGDGSSFATLTFRSISSRNSLTDQELATAFTLEETSVYDNNGLAISWFMPSNMPTPNTPTTGVDAQPYHTTMQIFLPMVSNGQLVTVAQSTSTDSPEQSEERLQTPENVEELYLPFFSGDNHDNQNLESQSPDSKNSDNPKDVQGSALKRSEQSDTPDSEEQTVSLPLPDADRRTYLPTIAKSKK